MAVFYNVMVLLSPRLLDLGIFFVSGCGAYSLVSFHFFLMTAKYLPYIFIYFFCHIYLDACLGFLFVVSRL